MNNSICTLFDNILIDIHKFKSLQQKNVDALLKHQNEKQKTLLKGELEWLTEKIKVFTEEEQKAILACACAFAEHDLIIAPSIAI